VIYHYLGKPDWHKICDHIRTSEPRFYWDPWLRRITFRGSTFPCVLDPNQDAALIVLEVPNHLYQEFIEENLESILVRTAQALYGGRFSVSYRLGEVS
jgi:hypothetical protein